METKKKKINKLFLIGNGLDLALDLKTSYQDFILWLLKKYIIKAYESKIFIAPDKYTKKTGNNPKFQFNQKRYVEGYSSNYLFDILINYNYHSISDLSSINSFFKLIEHCKKNKIDINSNNKNGLFNQIKTDSELGWVDIEGIYFDQLKLIINNSKYADKDFIEIINTEMSTLKKFLFEYLSEIEINIDREKIKEYQKQFGSDIELNNYISLNKQKKSELKSSLEKSIHYFLNFNYTNSLKVLLKGFQYLNSTNHIHGNLKDSQESIIFGYGDEIDNTYKDIEELNDNRFFKHIKSFQYFKSKKYLELLSFVNSDDFHVYIYGHSCGLSDRVMLNEIFEHENCKAIKIFFYDEKDYDNKTMEISRHFNNNQEMRKKILNFDENNRIPQVNDN